MTTLNQLNIISKQEFADKLGGIFEHSRWIAEEAALRRPFLSIQELFQTMVEIVQNAPQAKQLALIKAHPNLGDRLDMSVDSKKEQVSAGLNHLSLQEYNKFRTANQLYMDKFAFPFIMAIKNKDKQTIYQVLETRLHHEASKEFQTALSEIYKIAFFRLQEKIDSKGDLKMKNQSNEKSLCYGKGNVFAYRTYANPLTGTAAIPESNFSGRKNILFGTNVKVSVGGKAFIPSFTEGNNSLVVATDSMKNFIQRHLATYDGSTLEGFAAYVSHAFLDRYPQIDTVKLIAEDIPFENAVVDSNGSLKTSDLVFKKSRNEKSQASIEIMRTESGKVIISQSSAILDLQLIKVSGNSFVGFVRDEYTTLPEDGNRPLFVYLNIHWVYGEQDDAFGDTPAKYAAAEQILDLSTSIFHNMQTPSIQNLIYEIGCTILKRFPQLLEVTFESQNHTWDTVVGEIPGSSGKIYTEPRPPYGFQVFTVTREHIRSKQALAAHDAEMS